MSHLQPGRQDGLLLFFLPLLLGLFRALFRQAPGNSQRLALPFRSISQAWGGFLDMDITLAGLRETRPGFLQCGWWAWEVSLTPACGFTCMYTYTHALTCADTCADTGQRQTWETQHLFLPNHQHCCTSMKGGNMWISRWISGELGIIKSPLKYVHRQAQKVTFKYFRMWSSFFVVF